MKKVILSLFLILGLSFIIACDETGSKKDDDKPVINITETTLTIGVGETYTFDIDFEILLQTSSKSTVAVNETEKSITGVKEGTADITIYAQSDTTVFKTITVTVGEVNLEGINAIDSYVKETIGTEGEDRIKLPTTHPELGGTITWECDSTVIKIDKGICDVADNDQIVTLTYTIDFDGETKTGSIEYTIIGFNMIDAASAFINQIKGSKISGDLNLKTSFNNCGGTTVTWSSSDTNVLSNTGKFSKPEDDCNITITYTVTTTSPATTHTYSKTFAVEGKTLLEKVEPIIEWIDENIAPDGVITETTELPTRLPEFGATLKYQDTDGYPFNVNKYLANPIISGRFVMYIVIETNAGTVTHEKVCSVSSSSENSIWDNIELFLNQIANNNYKTTKKPTTGQGYLYKYGYLPFFTSGKLAVEERLINSGTAARPGTIKTKTQYIVVHDTGNQGAGTDVEMTVNYLHNIQNTESKSWHYTVDEDNCVRTIPDNEVSWHAGDGTRKYGTTYHNDTYNADCIGGGNMSGISIESCVNSDGDYGMTERNLAKLVAQLLLENNLTIDRIKQHNDFSGKDCPAVLRALGFWNRFIYLVQLELYGQTVLSDVEFTWTPVSDNLSEKGVITQKTGTVSYSVTARYNGQSKTYNYTVTI